MNLWRYLHKGQGSLTFMGRQTQMSMIKLIKTKDNENEYCVLCGVKTQYKKSEPIQNRTGYEVGVGQRCEHCDRRMKMEDLAADYIKRLQNMGGNDGG